jgi:hypothetical protein
MSRSQKSDGGKPVRSRTLGVAVDYIDQHFGKRFIFPIAPGKKFPPLIKRNLADASNDPEQLRAWEKQWPGCSWGVSLAKSELMVADVDTNPKKNKVGQLTYDDLDLMYGWPETETTTTPSGGFHKIYEGWANDDHPAHIMALGENGFGKDIDVPNYLLIPGCTLDDGTSYTTNGLDAVAAEPWMYDTIKSSKIKSRIADAGEIVVELDQQTNIDLAIDYLINDAEPSIENQLGDNTLFKVAAYLKDIGISQGLGAQLLEEYFNPRCEPMWPAEMFATKMASAYTSGSLSKVGGKTAEAEFSDVVEEPMPPLSPLAKKQKKERAKARDTETVRKTVGTYKGRKWTKDQVIDEWVYVIEIASWLRINDEVAENSSLKPLSCDKFNNAFSYLAKTGKISDVLLKMKKGGVRRMDRLVYQPGEGQFLGETGTLLNMYRPSPIKPAEASTNKARAAVEMWDAHLEYLFPDQANRDHALNWMAWLLQNIALKPKHALILQGEKQGTGKTFLARMMRAILGSYNAKVISQSAITGTFNPWAQHSKLLVVEELHSVNKVVASNKFHDLITEEPIEINIKNQTQFEIDNCFGVMAMTNADDPVSIGRFDRRYLILRTLAEPRGAAYFNALYALLRDPAAIAAIGWELLERDVMGYNGQGPAPSTAAKAAVVDASATGLEFWMMERAEMWPLKGRLITIDDVINVLPHRHERERGVEKSIATILKHKFKGDPLGKVSLGDGTRVPLWAINDRLTVGEIGKRDTDERTKRSNARLAKMYLADRDAAGKGGNYILDKYG